MADGTLQPAMPTCCPWDEGEGCSDRITVHHWRDRQTGPGFPLMVVLCRGHGHAFTVYPPGYAPYARKPLVAVAPDGCVLHRSKPPGEQPDKSAWEATLFEAALDAAAGEAWRPQGAAFTTGQWRTQQRHIEQCLSLFALSPNVTQRQRHEVGELIGIAYVDLQHAAQEVGTASGYRQRGLAVQEILSRLQPLRRGRDMTSLPADLLRCGAVAGMWTEPMFL